ncbi:MAG: hypothetical protein ACR2GR_03955 [Rhodothermales bacterium]
MHDLDRTLLELQNGHDEYEYEDEYEDEYEFEFETDGPCDEATEMELAAELLTVGSDEELEYFLGKLISRAAKGVKRFAKSKAGRALGGVLKNVGKKALPIAGAALGNVIAPGVGGAIGGKLASAAGRAFGLELEGLSPEDQEFEVAKRFVRFSGEAAKKAAQAPPTAPTKAVVNRAVKTAAKKHAPGLTRPSSSMSQGSMMGSGGSGRRSGRWMRRGRKIILFGV